MSAIPAERCIGGIDLTEPRLSPDGALLVYVRSSGGAAALMLSTLDGAPARQLSAFPSPRAGRGLGGGCWCWTPDSAAVVYSAVDGNLWLQPVPGGSIRRLSQVPVGSAAQAPIVTTDGSAVVYVLDQGEVWLQPLKGESPTRLDDGSADFCFDPTVMSVGEVIWQAWNVPDMAWDSSRLEMVNLRSGDRDTITGTGAIQQPRSMLDGALLSVRDDTGWNNVWLGDRALVGESFEHAGPTWGLGQRSFDASSDGTQVAFTRNEHGFGRLCVVEVASGSVREVARAVHGQISWQGGRVAALRTGARTPPQIVVYDTAAWGRTVIDVGSVSGWENESLAEPELVQIVARDGATIHARLYRADQSTDQLICWLHGGPTDQWQVTFMPRIAFWRSRGFNILVPDHRGSSGHGRDYQQALNRRWGDIDVTDTIDAIVDAQRRGWADPARTVLCGGSAGGFTVLGVLAANPVGHSVLAACAIVSYPVTDLFDVADRGDRFERHQTHHLVDVIPASRPLVGPYVERSPVFFAERITTPLLMFHGDIDPVVPVEQSQTTSERIRAAGGDVELIVYAGEGHGFRKPENQLDEYRRTEDFIAEHIDVSAQ